jgi:predicted AlkP superfamily pyrophosphatase or phosphodiesterase
MSGASPDKWTLAERLRASFDAQRSGDRLVVLKPHISPIAEPKQSVATHGSPWDYDRRVPIVLWRPGLARNDRAEAVETVDIMPTLAALLGVRIDPASIDGKCLTGVSGVACPPR